MKLEIEVRDEFCTKKQLKEIENLLVKKIIVVKCGMATMDITDVFMQAVMIALKKKLEEK